MLSFWSLQPTSSSPSASMALFAYDVLRRWQTHVPRRLRSPLLSKELKVIIELSFRRDPFCSKHSGNRILPPMGVIGSSMSSPVGRCCAGSPNCAVFRALSIISDNKFPATTLGFIGWNFGALSAGPRGFRRALSCGGQIGLCNYRAHQLRFRWSCLHIKQWCTSCRTSQPTSESTRHGTIASGVAYCKRHLKRISAGFSDSYVTRRALVSTLFSPPLKPA